MIRISADLLDFASLFTYRATHDEIEHERRSLEAEHGFGIAIFEIEHPTMSGVTMTRVSWERKP
jgi:hypothetical protein